MQVKPCVCRFFVGGINWWIGGVLPLKGRTFSMDESSRRNFLRMNVVGAVGLGMFGMATESSGGVDGGIEALSAEQELLLTEDNILGPYHLKGSLVRGKVSEPMSRGDVILISGTVYGLDTRKPLRNVVIDIWQADHAGRYDMEVKGRGLPISEYKNRIRIVTDIDGKYCYESVRPGRYLNGREYRPSHIHYLVQAKGYKRLVTQLYFKDDPYNEKDAFVKASLIIEMKKTKGMAGDYEVGEFDIVLGR